MLWLGIFLNTYGNCCALIPPLPNPPVDQVFDCQAVIVPSFFAPTLTFPNTDGRLPAICNSVERSRNIFTGFPPLSLERRAACSPQRSAGNLLPNPPPI